jgi:hypothetical protein
MRRSGFSDLAGRGDRIVEPNFQVPRFHGANAASQKHLELNGAKPGFRAQPPMRNVVTRTTDPRRFN